MDPVQDTNQKAAAETSTATVQAAADAAAVSTAAVASAESTAMEQTNPGVASGPAAQSETVAAAPEPSVTTPTEASASSEAAPEVETASAPATSPTVAEASPSVAKNGPETASPVPTSNESPSEPATQQAANSATVSADAVQTAPTSEPVAVNTDASASNQSTDVAQVDKLNDWIAKQDEEIAQLHKQVSDLTAENTTLKTAVPIDQPPVNKSEPAVTVEQLLQVRTRRTVTIADVTYEPGILLGEVKLADGITLNYLVDAIRNDFAHEVKSE